MWECDSTAYYLHRSHCPFLWLTFDMYINNRVYLCPKCMKFLCSTKIDVFCLKKKNDDFHFSNRFLHKMLGMPLWFRSKMCRSIWQQYTFNHRLQTGGIVGSFAWRSADYVPKNSTKGYLFASVFTFIASLSISLIFCPIFCQIFCLIAKKNHYFREYP